MDKTSGRLAARAGLILAALLLGGCNVIRPDAAPSLQQELDTLHADDRRAWRDEMRRLLLEGRNGIPEKHLALAIDMFNRGGDQEMLMESVWRYLDQRRGDASRLKTDSDRRLLHTYAEAALRSTEAKHRERLDTLCLHLESEPACGGD